MCQRRGLFFDHGGQCLQGLLLEQVARLQAQAGTTGAADHLDRNDRVTAQLEEVVLTPDLLDTQDVLPDPRQHLLVLAARRFEGALTDVCGRRRQAFAVEFAVGAQGHLFDQHGLRRHHVIRQAGEQMAFQGFTPGALLLGISAHPCAILRHDVGDQLLTARAVECQDHGFLHVGVFLQARFDFPQLDTQTSNLHLMVDTAAVFDGAISAITRQVAGAIQALATAERVDHKTLGGQRATAVVAARQADAAQVQLAHRAQRQGLQFTVEDAGAQVGNRTADRHAVAAFFHARPVGDIDGRFGRAIQVVEMGVRQCAQRLALQFHRQRFTAANDPCQRSAGQCLVGRDKGREHRGYEVQRGDRLLDNQRRQALRITMLAGRGEDQGGALHQRPEKLPHRHVETERRFLQYAVRWQQVVGLLHPLQTVVQGHMTVARAFGFASGTGGVNHIGEVFGDREVVQVGARQILQPIGLGVQAQGAHGVRGRQLFQQMRLGQQQRNAAVVDHVAQAIQRVFRVERHISAASLENRQQADDHFERAVAGDPHQHFRADALGAQMMSQTVGTQVQIGVRQLLPLEHQRRRIAVFSHAFFEMTLHTDFARVASGGVIKVVEHAQTLVVFQQGQLRERALRVCQQPGQQVFPMPRQMLDALGVEQIRGVGQAGKQLVALLLCVQLQVELGGVRRRVQRLDSQPGEQATDGRRLRLLMVEHHLEQRAVAQAAVTLQRLDKTFERNVLIALGVQRCGAGLVEQLAERQAPVQFGAHHLGVDEKADQTTGFRTMTVGNRYADAQIGLAAVAIEQCLKTREQQHERCDAALLGQGHQPTGQGRIEGEIQTRTALARLCRARTVGGQFEQRLFAAQGVTPPVELSLQLAGFHPAALPQGVVRVLDRQRVQGSALPLAMGGVESGKLFDQHAHRPAIRDDVVQGQQQHMVLVIELQQADAQQWTLLQIERPGDVLLDAVHGAGEALLLGFTAQVDHFDGQRGEFSQGLHDLPVVLDEAAAQALMPLQQHVETVLQRFNIQRPVQAQRRGNVVGRTLWIKLPEEPLALLGIGQFEAFLQLGGWRNRQLTEAHALLLHACQKLAALVGRQAGEAAGDTLGSGVFHQLISISSRSDSSAFRRASLSVGACCPAMAA